MCYFLYKILLNSISPISSNNNNKEEGIVNEYYCEEIKTKLREKGTTVLLLLQAFMQCCVESFILKKLYIFITCLSIANNSQ